jgi:hypothetical protein
VRVAWSRSICLRRLCRRGPDAAGVRAAGLLRGVVRPVDKDGRAGLTRIICPTPSRDIVVVLARWASTAGRATGWEADVRRLCADDQSAKSLCDASYSTSGKVRGATTPDLPP